MPSLPTDLLTTFDKAVSSARDVAEEGARAALTTLAVARDRPFDTLNEPQRALRRALRARARQLGEDNFAAGLLRLVEEIAYEHWHRLLFARFLAENNLLMHPEGVAVTLEECAELAPEEGAEDRWELAARYAVGMLPGIFALDDPAMQVRYAPEYRRPLEQIVTDLPRVIFTADDGLGWAYQFWQSKKKAEVNASERKIGGADIAPVTQLFTEDYMVKFLLHNSLGAWWAARHPDSPLVKTFDYLRFREDGAPAAGVPAAGTFEGWPKRAAEVTMMDPCCGSGHFIVAAFLMLTRMRMEEEGLSVAEAGDAVIRDNVFGLEIDPRCTQIAAFNLALAAWKSGGYRSLPLPNIACSGIPVQGQLEDWVKLAGNDGALQQTMERLYKLFRNASDLGSLINPSYVPLQERLFIDNLKQIELLFEIAIQQIDSTEDPTAALFGDNFRGIKKTLELLASTYVLVVTNVPYLGSKKQSDPLRNFSEEQYPYSKMDLATVFIERCRSYTRHSGSYALVTPYNWTFLVSYSELRKKLLQEQTWNMVVNLGPKAFRTPMWDFHVGLTIFSNRPPADDSSLVGMDIADLGSPSEKANALYDSNLSIIDQAEQITTPDSRIVLDDLAGGPLLEEYASCYAGILNGDSPKFIKYFWEVVEYGELWTFLQSTVSETLFYGGRQKIIFYDSKSGHLRESAEVRRVKLHDSDQRGNKAWDKMGVAISQIGDFPVTLYTGEKFDSNVAVLCPTDQSLVPALWAYCSSPEFHRTVRKLDRKLNVTNATFGKVPFDPNHWQEVAEQAGPLPEPYSNDPTQWLFKGDPVEATDPLQVAVARLAGYQWPEQKDDALTPLADRDGVLCLPAIAGHPPAAKRLRALLATAYGAAWNLERQRELLAGVGFKGKGLDEWLRDGFFPQHCKRFSNRPFIWHLWDGRRDGFNVLVNYHKLDAARLEKLIYTYLGDWIRTQQAEQARDVAGAEGRLVAALGLRKKLEAILMGEPPYDIYVRWKALHEQPIGWNPDLNDGVRLNIRPFVAAGVLRSKFTIHWKKDRGKNPDGSERLNDLHFTRAEKEAARRKVRDGRSLPPSPGAGEQG